MSLSIFDCASTISVHYTAISIVTSDNDPMMLKRDHIPQFENASTSVHAFFNCCHRFEFLQHNNSKDNSLSPHEGFSAPHGGLSFYSLLFVGRRTWETVLKAPCLSRRRPGCHLPPSPRWPVFLENLSSPSQVLSGSMWLRALSPFSPQKTERLSAFRFRENGSVWEYKSGMVPLDDDECFVRLDANRSHGWPQVPFNLALGS